MCRLTVFLASFLFTATCLPAQKTNSDSLWQVYHNTAEPDSNRLKAIHLLSWSIVFPLPDSSLALARIEYDLARRDKNLRYESNAFNTMGVASINKGNADSALIFYTRALQLREQLGDKKGQAGSLNNIGTVYYKRGDYPKALEYYQKSLRIKESLGDMPGVAAACSNIGMIYEEQGEKEKMLSCYYRALRIRDSLNDTRGLADAYSKLGGYYVTEKEYDKAWECVAKSAQYAGAADDTKSLANAIANMGLIYERKGNNDSAYACYARALQLRKGSSDRGGLASSYNGLGNLENQLGHYDKAIGYCREGLAIAEEIGFPELIESSCSCLAKAYEGTNDFRSALLYYKRSATLTDSLNGVEKSKAITRKQVQYEYEKRQLSDSLRVAKEEEVKEIAHREEIRQQKLYTAAGAAGFLLMLALAFVLFRSSRQKQRSNLELEAKNTVITSQKLEVEEKNREILSSITYAQRLQEAILPSWETWRRQLPESFIFYRPKDIVAGDFYWMETLPSEKDMLLFAVADCTGHGVPGALVSVVCSNALNRAVKEFGLTAPGAILDKVTELVLETFEKSGSDVYDGMDISLCRLGRCGGELQWAGANLPLWIARQNGDGLLTELAPDKQPIGKFDHRKPFRTHMVPVQPGDMLFLFSDGYADQFGGPAGKKFKYSQLKALLQSGSAQSPEKQQERVAAAFDAWRGALMQVDDVCVMGVRI